MSLHPLKRTWYTIFLEGRGAQEVDWRSCLHWMQCKDATGDRLLHLYLWQSLQSLVKFHYRESETILMLCFQMLQNVKAVFDAAIKVVLQPPKQKKKKRKGQKACSILWLPKKLQGERERERESLVISLPCCLVSSDFIFHHQALVNHPLGRSSAILCPSFKCFWSRRVVTWKTSGS